MKKVLSAILLLFVAQLASAQCAQIFSALSIDGVQYPVLQTHSFPPRIVAGVISLNVQFRDGNDAVTPTNGVTLRYTIDNQPVGPVLTDQFFWALDTTTLTQGTHALSVLYVNVPASQDSCRSFLGRQYAFVVSNNEVVVNGPQTIPVIAPPVNYGPLVPQYADFISYPGYQPHSTAHPFPYKFVPPTGGATPTDFWIEPLLSSTSNTGESKPGYWQLKNGSIVEDSLFSNVFLCDDLRMPNYAFTIAGPTWEQRKGRYDGAQDDVSLGSYTVFVPNLDGRGFYGIGMDGRLFFLDMDGSVQTVAGWTTKRTVTPYHYLDDSIPLASVRRKQTLIGNFDVQFNFPTDLAVDPNNHRRIFVADMNNHRIAMVDLSQTPPTISTYAGIPGHAGYLDGPAASSLFNQPSSIAIAADGTIYVADAENGAIRVISPSLNVSTLVGHGPLWEPSSRVVAAAPLTFAPRLNVPFSSAFINYPNTLRFDSQANLVLAETVTYAIRYIDFQARTVTTIAQLSATGNGFGEQVWLDVDRNGNIGAKDDIIATMVAAHQNGLYRIPIKGTSVTPPPTITTHSTYPVYSGHSVQSSMPWTSAPWSVAIDDQEGRIMVSGVQSSGAVSLRLIQSTDPPFQLNLAAYTAGRNIWFNGTVPNFPFGSRPSFAALHGYEGHSGLGNVMNFDDLAVLTDTQLATYLQSGAEGAVPRPELTGNDLRNVIYYIRRTTLEGDKIALGITANATTVPAISSVAANQTSSTAASVSWITNQPTLGFAAWGTTSGNYFGWSQIEAGYSTAHALTVTNLPAGQTIYLVVRAKDQAGNQTVTTEQTLTLQ